LQILEVDVHFDIEGMFKHNIARVKQILKLHSVSHFVFGIKIANDDGIVLVIIMDLTVFLWGGSSIVLTDSFEHFIDFVDIE